MSSDSTSSLIALPIELIYHILNPLEPKDLFLAIRNVSQRLDSITDTYRPYQVNRELES